ncbi:MAG TPA: SH3 domain-containing protein, partial [Elusimicrobiales bacterium]|nr:SH3 domain-containing protein [Elusimicrobiales bacterium]
AGLQDAASYNSGYAQGQAAAAVIEVQNGEKAGYQAGFSQRELELENSFSGAKSLAGDFTKSVMKMSEKMDQPIELARSGYTTPEEKRAYEEGYKEGYQRSYRRAYDDAKRDGYNERYSNAYRRAYDGQYSISYRNGFAEGKEKGYREAYQAAYNSAYNDYYQEYSNREYADQRAQGLNNGQVAGNREGFAAGCAEQTKRGYKAGYERTAAEVYPGAFSAGKQAGIAAADRYYSENAVLKVFDISFYDENTNGSFEAGENIMMRAELRNFGFQNSDSISMSVKSERGEILFVADLRADGVSGRAKSALNLKVGRLSDIVAPGADALYVTFSEKGRQIGDFRQMYSRTNSNKVGIVTKDKSKVRAKAAWLFSKKLATLKLGEKVIITGKDGNWYKVKRSETGEGNWTEGYIKNKRLNVQ